MIVVLAMRDCSGWLKRRSASRVPRGRFDAAGAVFEPRAERPRGRRRVPRIINPRLWRCYRGQQIIVRRRFVRYANTDHLVRLYFSPYKLPLRPFSCVLRGEGLWIGKRASLASLQLSPISTRLLVRFINSVDATRIGVKQRELLVLGKIADDALEAIEDRIKGRP